MENDRLSAALSRPADPHVTIYVVGESKNGSLKIGFASSMKGRLASLQLGNHRELHIFYSVGVSTGWRQLERTIHATLAMHHVRGEWYDVAVSEAITAIGDAMRSVQSDAA